MVSDISGLTNSTGFYDIVRYANDVSTYNGISFFSMFIVILWFIIFFTLKRNDTLDAFIVASFACFIFSLMLSSLQLLSSFFIFPFLGLSILSAFWIWHSRKF